MAALPHLFAAPLELGRLSRPFDHPAWVFELKYDGFRARADVSDGKAELASRRGNFYKSFAALCAGLGRQLEGHRAVLDGELVVLDPEGRPSFLDLLRRGRPAVFIAFDLLYLDGEDLRALPLLERKRRLRELVPHDSKALLYAPHVPTEGRMLFSKACALDLEGIVAKLSFAPYARTDPPHWFEIRNPNYTQAKGRHELFRGR